MSILEATRNLLSDINEPEKSLIFPIVFQIKLASNNNNVKPTSISHMVVSEQEVGNYAGLSGGLRQLLESGFFQQARKAREIQDELRRNAYTYPRTSLPPLLISFINKRILVRERGTDGQWIYIKRK